MKHIATLLTTIIAATLALSSAFAGDGKTFKDYKEVETSTSLFRDQELQIDGFFIQTFAGRTNGQEINTGPGGGFAINGIFARYFGLGVENYWSSNDNRGSYTLGGFGILRYPIDSLNIAPYVLVGGGAGFSKTNYGFGSLGLGAEYRFTKNLGTFVDGRWYYGAPDQAGVLRTGLRYSF